MSDKKPIIPVRPILETKGYVPAGPKIQGGYTGPTTSQQAAPPKGGTSVQPPPAKK